MHFSAALLAGGRSSRMGRDKAFLEIDGVPLWQRQLQTLRELGPAEIFIAGPAQTEWHEFEVVPDAAPDCGPLGGLVAALRRCKYEHLLVLAIDLPRMTPVFFRRLLGMCFDGTGAVPKRESGASFQLANQNTGKLKTYPTLFEPLAAIYPNRCLPLAENCLNSGEYALQEFVCRAVKANFLATREIAQFEESLFFNVNTPTDLASLAQE